MFLPKKIGHRLLLFLSAQPYVKTFDKIISRTPFLMHYFTFRPNYIFNDHDFFPVFCSQKYILIFSFIKPVLHQQIMHFGSLTCEKQYEKKI